MDRIDLSAHLLKKTYFPPVSLKAFLRVKKRSDTLDFFCVHQNSTFHAPVFKNSFAHVTNMIKLYREFTCFRELCTEEY